MGKKICITKMNKGKSQDMSGETCVVDKAVEMIEKSEYISYFKKICKRKSQMPRVHQKYQETLQHFAVALTDLLGLIGDQGYFIQILVCWVSVTSFTDLKVAHLRNSFSKSQFFIINLYNMAI